MNKLAVEALQERGYRVLSAPDGAAALQLIDGAPRSICCSPTSCCPAA